MKVLYVTAECWPFAKTGGLGDGAYPEPQSAYDGCREAIGRRESGNYIK